MDDAFDPHAGHQGGAALCDRGQGRHHPRLVVGGAVHRHFEVADESQTVQLAFSPIELKPGRGAWTYRLAQPVKLMADAVATGRRPMA